MEDKIDSMWNIGKNHLCQQASTPKGRNQEGSHDEDQREDDIHEEDELYNGSYKVRHVGRVFELLLR